MSAATSRLLRPLINRLKCLFVRSIPQNIEPLLHSNVELLYTEWSNGFDMPLPANEPHLPSEVTGNYAISGHNAGNRENGYFGTLSLQTKGHFVKAYWEIGHSREPQFGFGFIKGDLIALDFYYTEGATRFYGQVIYKATGDSLTGFWRENHVGSIAFEKATLKNRL